MISSNIHHFSQGTFGYVIHLDQLRGFVLQKLFQGYQVKTLRFQVFFRLR